MGIFSSKPSKAEQEKNYRAYRRIMDTPGPEKEVDRAFAKLTLMQKVRGEHRPGWSVEQERQRKAAKEQRKQVKRNR